MDKITELIRQDAQRIINRVDLSPLKDKCVVVTGASGIIGTYVLAVLDIFGQCKTVIRVSSKEIPRGHPAREFCSKWINVAYDLTKVHDWDLPSDYIFYGAGYGQPSKFMDNPLGTIAINTTGLSVALENLNTDGGRLLYTSSSEVYSGNPKPPFHEGDIGTTTPQHPRACYIEAKRCGEAICSAFNTGKPGRAVAARIALAYGPGTRKDDGRALNQFIRRAIQDRRILLQDSGQVIRTYCYITDTVEMLFNMWLRGRYEVYNVAGRSKVTIAALARKIGEICDVPVDIPPTSDQFQASAPDNVSLDMRLTESEFDKHDYVPLEEGLRRTIEWQKVLYAQV